MFSNLFLILVSFFLFLMGLFLHRIGTIRKWELEQDNDSVKE